MLQWDYDRKMRKVDFERNRAITTMHPSFNEKAAIEMRSNSSPVPRPPGANAVTVAATNLTREKFGNVGAVLPAILTLRASVSPTGAASTKADP